MVHRQDLAVSPVRSANGVDPGVGSREPTLNRRQFLQRSALASISLVPGFERLSGMPVEDPFPGGRFVGSMAFEDEPLAPVNMPIGTELDGRLYTDLSRVSPKRLVTPTAEFYVRTAASRLLPDPNGWRIDVDGLVEKPSQLDIHTLRSGAKP